MFDLGEIGGHVKDAHGFHFPGGIHTTLPVIDIFGYELQVTKFMVLELIAAALMLIIFVPLAWRMRKGAAPRGRIWNFLEAILVFIRNEVARPAIGEKDADRFLPFLWNVFFFVLLCNLLGMVPWMGSPTGSIMVTGTLAMCMFAMTTATGMREHGMVGFWKGLVPHMDVPGPMAIFLKPMLFVIEVLGLVIKHSVLAVRLMANMFAGHLVLAVIVSFIAAAAHTWLILWIGITVGSLGGAVAISLLELFVAFLQAYIFTFLSALFIGMAIHQH
jgi:F-type H+-transporting ATPase subunit a